MAKFTNRGKTVTNGLLTLLTASVTTLGIWFSKDTTRRDKQEAWQNNQNDCIKEIQDSLIKYSKNRN